MNSFRDSLPVEIWQRMRQELGWEETLRLLWPVLVGARLGCHTHLRSVRNATLRVGVPDKVWSKTLGSMERMILDAVNRFWGEEIWRTLEFVEEPTQPNPPNAARPKLRAENRVPLPDVSATNLPAPEVRDDELRQAFLQSAGKYFAWQEEHRK